MIVRAAPGLRVPMEGAPRQYITDNEPQAVPESAYYLRRIADGDLIQVADVTADAPAKPKAKEAANG